MRKTQITNHTIDMVFVLVLFSVFAISVLLVLLAGAGVYQDIANRMEKQYTERTGLAYLDVKIRHYDEMGMVALESFGDCEALALYEIIDGIRYKTLIYCYDGYIRELFFEEGLDFRPEDGQRVVAAKALSVEWVSENLLRLLCTSETEQQEELLLYLQSDRGVDQYA